ncbi:MAG: hypothetical protein K0S21_328 [Rhizobiaceae bacterium]|nr:hypothetical protein [Rhizobiaceae bacterium]
MSQRGQPSLRARLITAAAIAAHLAIAAAWPAAAGPVDRIEIDSRAIGSFRIGESRMRFGQLEFVGGLEMTSPAGEFGALSAFRFLTPGADFIGIADTGFWFFGTVERDAERRPIGIQDFRMAPILDRSGRAGAAKAEVDAEGLEVADGIAIVGFERHHRIARYRIDPGGMGPALGEVDFLVPARELRGNRGFETVARAAAGPQAGRLVVVSEKSLDASGNIFAAIVEGPGTGVFAVRRDGEFDITDGAFLPGGDLLVLERSFTMTAGVAMRLRRIEAASMEKGKVADGPILIEADMGYQIDNMEGMDVWRRDDGAVMVSLISDDNQSLLQRSLYLEFILHQD